jgi:hypothetical protein
MDKKIPDRAVGNWRIWTEDSQLESRILPESLEFMRQRVWDLPRKRG